MSNSARPHRRQPTRLPCPWDSPGKNTGVGCHFLLQCMKVKSESEVVQSCPTLSNPMDCSPPGSSIHGIFQARVLEWGAIAFSKTILALPIWMPNCLCKFKILNLKFVVLFDWGLNLPMISNTWEFFFFKFYSPWVYITEHALPQNALLTKCQCS